MNFLIKLLVFAGLGAAFGAVLGYLGQCVGGS